MNADLLAAVEAMPRLSWRLDPLPAQLNDLEVVARRLGMHDAADFITKASKEKP